MTSNNTHEEQIRHLARTSPLALLSPDARPSSAVIQHLVDADPAGMVVKRDVLVATLEWHKGPAIGGAGPAGKDDATGAPLFYDGQRLLIAVDTELHGREYALVDIACDEDRWFATDVATGEFFDAWLPESWSWWAQLDKHNCPPQ